MLPEFLKTSTDSSRGDFDRFDLRFQIRVDEAFKEMRKHFRCGYLRQEEAGFVELWDGISRASLTLGLE